ncbi:MAG: hypothetical protein ACJ76D_06960 [Solirubrobacterales bacterium]
MSPYDHDRFTTTLLTARERDLKPLAEQAIEELDLGPEQLETLAFYLNRAWFFGIKTSYKIVVESKIGGKAVKPVLFSMHDEFREIIESCGDELKMTVGTTIKTFELLGEAWVRGVDFWEVESTALLLEHQEGGFGEVLERIEEEKEEDG